MSYLCQNYVKYILRFKNIKSIIYKCCDVPMRTTRLSYYVTNYTHITLCNYYYLYYINTTNVFMDIENKYTAYLFIIALSSQGTTKLELL